LHSLELAVRQNACRPPTPRRPRKLRESASIYRHVPGGANTGASCNDTTCRFRSRHFQTVGHPSSQGWLRRASPAIVDHAMRSPKRARRPSPGTWELRIGVDARETEVGNGAKRMRTTSPSRCRSLLHVAVRGHSSASSNLAFSVDGCFDSAANADCHRVTVCRSALQCRVASRLSVIHNLSPQTPMKTGPAVHVGLPPQVRPATPKGWAAVLSSSRATLIQHAKTRARAACPTAQCECVDVFPNNVESDREAAVSSNREAAVGSSDVEIKFGSCRHSCRRALRPVATRFGIT